jgi:hypothetical protein
MLEQDKRHVPLAHVSVCVADAVRRGDGFVRLT